MFKITANNLKTIQLNVLRVLLILFLFLQFMFWYKTEKFKPFLPIVPNIPSKHIVKAMSFGDEELYFRILASKLQNAGDTYGRVTPLKDYDYSKLYIWFTTLDTLDSRSNYVPSLAAYYYSQSQDPEDTKYIIDYLEEHADKDPEKKWWWYYQAMYIASYVYGDKDRALEISYKLKEKSGPDAPLWTKQMTAVILKDLGNDCESLRIINEIRNELQEKQNDKEFDRELNFMEYFIRERLEEIKKKNITPESCGVR